MSWYQLVPDYLSSPVTSPTTLLYYQDCAPAAAPVWVASALLLWWPAFFSSFRPQLKYYFFRDFPNHATEGSSQFPPLAAPNPISIMLALCDQFICWFIWIQLQYLRAHLNNNQLCKQSGKLVWNFSPDLLDPVFSTPQSQFLYLLIKNPPPKKRILLVQLSLDISH